MFAVVNVAVRPVVVVCMRPVELALPGFITQTGAVAYALANTIEQLVPLVKLMVPAVSFEPAVTANPEHVPIVGAAPEEIMWPIESISKLGNPLLVVVATAKIGLVPLPTTDRVANGVEVPMPSLGAKLVVSMLYTFVPTALKMLKAFVMFVGVLRIIPPVAVEEAKRPANRLSFVEVALVLMPKFCVGVHEKAPPPPPVALIVTSPVPPPPVEEMLTLVPAIIEDTPAPPVIAPQVMLPELSVVSARVVLQAPNLLMVVLPLFAI